MKVKVKKVKVPKNVTKLLESDGKTYTIVGSTDNLVVGIERVAEDILAKDVECEMHLDCIILPKKSIHLQKVEAVDK